MDWLRAFAHDAGAIAWENRWWMTWNTLLAVLPALIAVPLFRHTARWRPLRWMALGGFLLVLPNAPYVVTDLVHLRADVAQAGSDATVYAGILPLYATFVAISFLSYAASLHEVGGWLRRTGRGRSVVGVELGLHALCAVGVLLGRVSRLNSWDTLTQPETTLARALDTLSWRASPVVIAVLFVVVWLGHSVTRVLATAGGAWLARHLPGPRGTKAAAPA